SLIKLRSLLGTFLSHYSLSGIIRLPGRYTLFPYTTLFRSHVSPDNKWLVFVSFPEEVPADEHPFYQRVYIRLMPVEGGEPKVIGDRKSTRLNSSHVRISYAVFCS